MSAPHDRFQDPPRDDGPDDPPRAKDTPSPTNFWQRLLDPGALQSLMTAGGGLLAVGLIIWLAVIGVFDQPINGAIGLGLANLAVLAVGVATVAKTPYRLAGRAVAMLACLLLPLNLWFYDAQGLITLNEGGHLWLPALVCCVIYVTVARALRDSLFVYPIVAGVAMTGLLFLADAQVDRLWEVIAPSTLLVLLGAACVHAERVFPAKTAVSGDDPFTRDDFGLAFFLAGHGLLASGLAVLLSGRLVGRFYDSLFHELDWFAIPDVATVPTVKFAALGLALFGAYTYAYSQCVAYAGRRFVLPAILMLAWSVLIGVDLLGIEFTEQVAVGALAVIAIGCRLGQMHFTYGLAGDGARQRSPGDRDVDRYLARTAACVGYVGLALALVQLVRGMLYEGPWGLEFGWDYVLAAGLVAIAHAIAAWIYRGERTEVSLTAFGVALTACVGGLVAWMPWHGRPEFAIHTAALTLVPFAFATVAVFSTDRLRKGASRAGEVTAILITLLGALTLAMSPTASTVLLFVVLALAFAWVAATNTRRTPVILSGLMASVALLEAIAVYDLGAKLPLLAISACGLVGIVLNRIRPSANLEFAGRLAITLSGIGGALLAGNRLLADEATLKLLGLLAAQTAIAIGAGALTSDSFSRRGMWLVGGLNTVVALFTLNALTLLTVPQRLELLATAVGGLILIMAHAEWRREATSNCEPTTTGGWVDVNLWLGSALASVPPLLGLLECRMFGASDTWLTLHNCGVLAVGLVLLGSGVLCRLRASTLCGVGVLACYLLSLIALVDVPDQLQNVAVYLMVGGGVLFGTAVILSVYRDRLLSLPARVREGEGVFVVLKWR